MTRRITKFGILAAATGLMVGGAAFATAIPMPTLTATSTVSGTTYTDTLTLSGASSPYTYNSGGFVFGSTVIPGGSDPNWNSETGWSVAGSVHDSSSFIDLGNVSAACSLTGTSCGDLSLTLMVSGLTSPVGENGLMSVLTGSLVSGSGTVTQEAWIGSTEIGTLLTSNGATSFSLSTTGGSANSGPYSLTLTDTFTGGCTGSNCVSYSTDGSVVATAEPGALVLFGAGLLGCALFVSRRRRASRQS